MTVTIDGGAGVTFPDTVQQTNAVTNTGGSPPYYAARAWVRFTGTGTPAVLAGANVSSITDNGTGDYTVNFTVAMPDANYVVVGAGRRGTANTRGIAFEVSPDNPPTTTSVRVRTVSVDTSPAPVDCEDVYVAVFR